MTRSPIVTFEAFDIVSVPFPFTDKDRTKKRPALILSDPSKFNRISGHSVMAMITSAKNQPWPLDASISDLASAGLPAPSLVRMKLFTLDNRLVLSKLGSLSEKDRNSVSRNLTEIFDSQMK